MSLEPALRELRIDYKIIGDEAVAKCPAHDDRHPSWSLNLKTGVHHCFSCGFSGNLAFLAMHMLNLSYPEAVIWCNERVGWARAHIWREDIENRNLSPTEMKFSEADLALFTDPPDYALESKHLTLKSARKFGVLWNPAEEEWILPVRDPYTTQLLGWQKKNARSFRNYPRGLKRSKTLFGLEIAEYGSPVILVESPIDCVYLDVTGQRGGVSSWGVSVSSYQFSLIQRITEHLILALDNDKPGVEETARICREFNGIRNIRIFNYGLSVGKDPGELTEEEVIFGVEHAVPSLRWMKLYKNGEISYHRKGTTVHSL